jgi:uncharacterized Tic20 family protein
MNLEELSSYVPNDYEAEKASNSYLMSVIGVMVGLPLPIVNMIGTLAFFLGNLKQSLYIRWHCTQALFSQIAIVCMNSVGFTWTMKIIFTDTEISNQYIAYMITVIAFNIVEFIATVYAAVVTRKGKHVDMWVFGPLTNLFFGKIK